MYLYVERYYVYFQVEGRYDIFCSQSSSFLADTPDKILREREKALKTVEIKTNKQGTN